MKKFVCIFTATLILTACENVQGTSTTADPDAQTTGVRPAERPTSVATDASAPVDATPAVKPPSNARTVEDFDTTSKAERQAAVEEAKDESGSKLLGTTIASLGDATEPGIWMKTPLVKSATKGRVEYPATGDAVAVDLIPLDGPASGGSQLSLAAFRLINAPITGLPELKVYRTN